MNRPRKSPVRKSRTYNKTEAEAVAARYCSYQERTAGEVRRKLQSLKFDIETAEEIVRKMQAEGFISEQRYADAYVRGKLNQDKWGRLKISYSLNKKGINQGLIDLVFNEYGEEKYRELMANLIWKKYGELKDENKLVRKHKTARFMISRGFESRLVWDILNDESL